MANSKILTLLICSVFLMTLVSAESFNFGQDEVVDYHFICTDNNNIHCTSGTTLVININAPNGTQVYDNITMTHNPTYYNVTLPTSDLGTYTSIILAPNNANTTTEFSYLVTPTGVTQTTAQGITSSAVLFLVFVLGVVLLVSGMLLMNKELFWLIGVLLMGFGGVLMAYSVNLSVVYIRDLAYTAGTATTQDSIFAVVSTLVRVGSWLFLPFLMIYWKKKYNDRNKNRQLDDGWDNRDFY